MILQRYSKFGKQNATIHQSKELQLNRLTIPSAGENFKELELSYIAGKNDIDTNALENGLMISCKT